MANRQYEGSWRDYDDDDDRSLRLDRDRWNTSRRPTSGRENDRWERSQFGNYGRGLDERGEYGRGESGYRSDWRGDVTSRDTMGRYGGERSNDYGDRSSYADRYATSGYGGGDSWQQRYGSSMSDRGVYGQRFGRTNEHDWRRTESDDFNDRTYGTHLGQGIGYDQNTYGRQGMYGSNYGTSPYGQRYGQSSYGSPSGYGAGSSGWNVDMDTDYGQRWNENEGPIAQLGHRIGSFVNRVIKRPFRGPKGYTRSDERIREDVCDALSNLGEADPSEVEVVVQSGEVTLTGTVPHRHWKHQMEDIAESVPGVKDVTNNIRVKTREVDIQRTTEDKSLSEMFTSQQNVSRRGNGNRTTHS